MQQREIREKFSFSCLLLSVSVTVQFVASCHVIVFISADAKRVAEDDVFAHIAADAEAFQEAPQEEIEQH